MIPIGELQHDKVDFRLDRRTLDFQRRGAVLVRLAPRDVLSCLSLDQVIDVLGAGTRVFGLGQVRRLAAIVAAQFRS